MAGVGGKPAGFYHVDSRAISRCAFRTVLPAKPPLSNSAARTRIRHTSPANRDASPAQAPDEAPGRRLQCLACPSQPESSTRRFVLCMTSSSPALLISQPAPLCNLPSRLHAVFVRPVAIAITQCPEFGLALGSNLVAQGGQAVDKHHQAVTRIADRLAASRYLLTQTGLACLDNDPSIPQEDQNFGPS
jgi:hypothetical protein